MRFFISGLTILISILGLNLISVRFFEGNNLLNQPVAGFDDIDLAFTLLLSGGRGRDNTGDQQ